MHFWRSQLFSEEFKKVAWWNEEINAELFESEEFQIYYAGTFVMSFALEQNGKEMLF